MRPSRGHSRCDRIRASLEHVSINREDECPVCGDSLPIVDLHDHVILCAKGLSRDAVTRVQLIELLHARERGETNFTLIDIREEYELFHGYIPGAINSPLSAFEPGALTGEVILYCQAGIRSRFLLDELAAQGFSGVKHYAGGYIDWVGGAQ